MRDAKCKIVLDALTVKHVITAIQDINYSNTKIFALNVASTRLEDARSATLL